MATANKRLIVHKGGQAFVYNVGDRVPKEHAVLVGREGLLSGAGAPDEAPVDDRFPDFGEAKKVEEVLVWISEGADEAAVKERAQFALDAENAKSKPRSGVVNAAAELLEAGE